MQTRIKYCLQGEMFSQYFKSCVLVLLGNTRKFSSKMIYSMLSAGSQAAFLCAKSKQFYDRMCKLWSTVFQRLHSINIGKSILHCKLFFSSNKEALFLNKEKIEKQECFFVWALKTTHWLFQLTTPYPPAMPRQSWELQVMKSVLLIK